MKRTYYTICTREGRQLRFDSKYSTIESAERAIDALLNPPKMIIFQTEINREYDSAGNLIKEETITKPIN